MLSGPAVMQLIIGKGADGFGFTISDCPYGQYVKQIYDRAQCNGLMVKCAFTSLFSAYLY